MQVDGFGGGQGGNADDSQQRQCWRCQGMGGSESWKVLWERGETGCGHSHRHQRKVTGEGFSIVAVLEMPGYGELAMSDGRGDAGGREEWRL